MKGGVRKKEFSILIISSYLLFPLIGWYMGGILFALIGLGLAFAMDLFFPTWKWDLTWRDIDRALDNIYKYGSNPCELCILVENRKIFVYRDDMGSKNRPIRMSIRLPTADWSYLFDEGDFNKLIDLFGGKGMYHKNRGPESYGIFPRDGLDGCKQILRFLFEKSVGGIRPNIYAKGSVNAKKNIWIEHPG